MRYNSKLKQFGMIVAEVDAPTEEQAEKEIQHYAMIYSQDGEVEIIRGYALSQNNEINIVSPEMKMSKKEMKEILKGDKLNE